MNNIYGKGDILYHAFNGEIHCVEVESTDPNHLYPCYVCYEISSGVKITVPHFELFKSKSKAEEYAKRDKKMRDEAKAKRNCEYMKDVLFKCSYDKSFAKELYKKLGELLNNE